MIMYFLKSLSFKYIQYQVLFLFLFFAKGNNTKSASHCALSKHSLDVWDLLVNYKTFQQALFMKQILY